MNVLLERYGVTMGAMCLDVAGTPGKQAAPVAEGRGASEDAVSRFQRSCLEQLPGHFSQAGEGVRQMTAACASSAKPVAHTSFFQDVLHAMYVVGSGSTDVHMRDHLGPVSD